MVDLTKRFIYWNNYLEAINLYDTIDLDLLLSRYKENIEKNRDICHCMAFLYPRLSWRERYIPEIDFRGEKVFQKQALPQDRKTCEICMAWGYSCEKNDIEYDHFWPYSLGGATTVDNLIALCTFHNRIKSNDYHWYPFEIYTEPPTWVILQSEALAEVIIKNRYRFKE